MAKSKMYAKAYTATQAYFEVYNRFLAEATGSGSLSDETLHSLQARGTAASAALTEAQTYFAGLDRRMGADKTMGDRLRNLKNVFKDSAQLAAARKKAKADLDYCVSEFGGIQRGIEMVAAFKNNGG